MEVEFWWPADVSRPYMPNPKNNFQAFAASLNKSGFKVVAKSAPWNPTYLGRADAGTAGALHLLGWTGDFGDASTFLDGVLRSYKQFGLPEDYALYKLLDKALIDTDADVRNATYRVVQQPVDEGSHRRAVRAYEARTRVQAWRDRLPAEPDHERVVRLRSEDRELTGTT